MGAQTRTATQGWMKRLQELQWAAATAGMQCTLLVMEFATVRLTGEPLAYAEQPKCLGVRYDQQLEFKQHVQDMVREMETGRGILVALTGTKWRCTARTLRMT